MTGSKPSCPRSTADVWVFPSNVRRRFSTSQPPSPLTDPGCCPRLLLPDVPGLGRATRGLIKGKRERTALESLLPALPWSFPPSDSAHSTCSTGASSQQSKSRQSAGYPQETAAACGAAGWALPGRAASAIKRKESGAENTDTNDGA